MSEGHVDDRELAVAQRLRRLADDVCQLSKDMKRAGILPRTRMWILDISTQFHTEAQILEQEHKHGHSSDV